MTEESIIETWTDHLAEGVFVEMSGDGRGGYLALNPQTHLIGTGSTPVEATLSLLGCMQAMLDMLIEQEHEREAVKSGESSLLAVLQSIFEEGRA